MWYEWLFMVVFIAEKPIKSGVFLWPVWVPMCFISALKETYLDGKQE